MCSFDARTIEIRIIFFKFNTWLMHFGHSIIAQIFASFEKWKEYFLRWGVENVETSYILNIRVSKMHILTSFKFQKCQICKYFLKCWSYRNAIIFISWESKLHVTSIECKKCLNGYIFDQSRADKVEAVNISSSDNIFMKITSSMDILDILNT